MRQANETRYFPRIAQSLLTLQERAIESQTWNRKNRQVLLLRHQYFTSMFLCDYHSQPACIEPTKKVHKESKFSFRFKKILCYLSGCTFLLSPHLHHKTPRLTLERNLHKHKIHSCEVNHRVSRQVDAISRNAGQGMGIMPFMTESRVCYICTFCCVMCLVHFLQMSV